MQRSLTCTRTTRWWTNRNKLHPFSNHPFHIRRDLEFSELVNSISESGIITPIIVRPKVGVGYKSYMTYNKSHVDDFLSHNRINHSEENFVLVKGDFEPIVSEKLWETCNQIRSKRAAFVKGKDGRAHKFGVSFPQNKWTKTLFCDCGMRFQIEGYRVWQKKRGRTALLF
jgi:hypothetical protein